MAAYAWTPSALIWLHVNHLIHGLHKRISWKNCLYAVNSYFTLARKKTPEEVCSSRTVDQTKLSRLILLLHCTAIAGYNTLVIAT